MFEWSGFKNLDLLSEWELYKSRGNFGPIIFQGDPVYIDPLNLHIEFVYGQIFDTSPLVTVKEIEERAEYVYKLIITTRDKFVEMQKISYANEYIEGDSTFIDCKYSTLLYRAHVQLSGLDKLEEAENYYILSLMLIDNFLNLDDENRYYYAVEAVDSFNLGLMELSIKERSRIQAQLRARIRHRERDIVHDYAIEIARNLKRKKPHLSTRQLAMKIADDVKDRSKKTKFRYSPDRFNQTIYDWLLKADKENSLN